MAAQADDDPRPGDGHCWPTPDQERLLAAALVEGPAGLAAWEEVARSLDLDGPDFGASMVLPLLFRRLKAQGVEDSRLGIFKGIHRRNWVRNERLLHAAWPVLGHLAARGIEVALLKGAALLATSYADLGLRYMADVDILVPTADRRRAIDALGECGFVPVDGFSPDAVDAIMPATTPSYGFRNAAGLSVDLHWNVLHQSRQPDADAAFWAAARRLEFRGLPIRVLDPSDQLLHVLAHGVRWNAMAPLRWVLDAAIVIGGTPGGPDWARLAEQARLRRLAVPIGRALGYLRRRYALPVPQETLDALRRSGSPLQRWEADLEERDPGGRTAFEDSGYAYLVALRDRTPLGRRPGWRAHLGALLDCRGLDRVRQLPADLLLARPFHPSALPRDAATPLAEGVRLNATRAAEFHRVVGRGWQRPEPHGTWTGRREALLRLRPEGRSGAPLALVFSGWAFVAERFPEQRLAVSIAGRRLADWPLRHKTEALPVARVPLPGADAGPVLEVRFRTGPLGSPWSAGVSADRRRLGLPGLAGAGADRDAAGRRGDPAGAGRQCGSLPRRRLAHGRPARRARRPKLAAAAGAVRRRPAPPHRRGRERAGRAAHGAGQ
ncbi:MAG: nucleotidyltransferase family protein [Dongiaceae bacterium]